MLKKIKEIYKNIKHLNSSVKNYTEDSIIQSLPTVAYVNKAIKLIEKKSYEEAEALLNTALDISSQDSLVYKYLGKISEIRKEFINATDYYERSAELNPNDKDIYLRLGMCYLYANCLDKAITSFENAEKITPLNSDVNTGWGMALMRKKKYALARDKFNIACNLNKYNFTAILLSAVMELRLEEYALAEEKLGFLVKVAPNESSFYEYANLKFKQEKFEEAEKYALKSVEKNEFMLPAYLLLGEIYSIEKDENKIETTFQKAQNLKLDNEVLHYEWGKAYIRIFEFDKAREQLNLSLNKNATYKDAKLALALLGAYRGNFSLLDKFSNYNLQNVYIQEALALEYLAQNKFDKAEEMFKKALNTDKYQTYIYYNLAQLYILQNNSYKVREYFDKFLMLNPQYAKGYVEYAKWLISVSDIAEAHRKLRKAQKLNPNNSEVLNFLFFTQYTLVKNNICEYNIKEAISIAQKAIDVGAFEYLPQLQELREILSDITANNNNKE